jgi:basic amino acid/polyamine antiporter, APA family
MGALIPLNELAKLVNIGTLSAFVLVSVAVVVLRKTQPDLPRAFRCPAVPWIPLLAVLFCGFLMLQLDGATWIRFLIWLGIGVVVYFSYSKGKSRLNENNKPLM